MLLGITCTGLGKISGWFSGCRLLAEKIEAGQSLGGSRKASSLLEGLIKNVNFCKEEVMAIDPVCGMEVDETHREFQTQFAGRKFYFCSEECRKEFENQPQEYVETAA